MPKTIGCKFCDYEAPSWSNLLGHSMGYHPIQYMEIQRWLKHGPTIPPTPKARMIEEWEEILKGLGVKHSS